jgi:sec-independent protein translocase protein TatC
MAVNEEVEMTFWDHLDDLRKVLFRILGVLLVLAIAFFAFMKDIFNHVIFAPAGNDFFLYRLINRLSQAFPIVPDNFTGDFQVNIININLTSQFFYHISTSFLFALVFGFPFIIYQIFSFIKPALYQNERTNAGLAFFFGNILFYIGVAVGYFIVFPLTLRFLAGYQLSTLIENSVSLDSYMNNFLMLCFVMGLVFELPILSWLLSRLGLLHRSFFSKYRRHAVVVLVILTAFITPSGDPFTLMVVFIPIYLLWEVSALLVKPEKEFV